METVADLGFSRGEWISKKKFENFVNLFLSLTKRIFRAQPKHQKDPVLTKFYAPQLKISKKQAKKNVFRHFLENVDQKLRCFRALPQS